MARRKRTRYNHTVGGKASRRKTYRKKTTAKRAARGRPVYKVKGGWRIGKRR